MAPSPDDRRADDLRLIEEILAGSVDHWHRFVERFAGLVYSVIRRQLFAEDEDEVRNVFADVLVDLHEGKLREYEGRADLSTWLIVVARGKSLDYLRSRDGRRTLPAGYGDLTDAEREVFRLYHVEGLPIEAVVISLEQLGHPLGVPEVGRAILRIESLVDRHYLRRLESSARARSLGVVSGRMLDFLTELRFRYEHADVDGPERALARQEHEARLARVRELVEALPEEERRVIRMRFQEGKTARRIAGELGLHGQRRVYTIIDSALRRLRKWMKED